jgi:hypothetical protein
MFPGGYIGNMAGKVEVVRWLYRFRGRAPAASDTAAWLAAARYELAASEERAAEPLWRGRTILGGQVGLGYEPDAVFRVRRCDCWSEPDGSGRLVLRSAKPLRAWRNWDQFARRWSRFQPWTHGEAWLRRGAQPIAVVLDRDTTREWAGPVARMLAAELKLPLVIIGRVPS